MAKINATCSTSGDGYWSSCITDLPHHEMKLNYINESNEFGELHVFFKPTDWNVEINGLVYSGSLWVKDFGMYLESIGLPTDISYSEQGMQGYSFVSLDVGPKFLAAYSVRYPQECKDFLTNEC